MNNNFQEQEALLAAYFDAEALRSEPEAVYRIQKGGRRYYYRFTESGDPDFLPSVTTLTKAVLPTSPWLIKWIGDMGTDRAEAYRDERAHYGTVMHGLIAQLLIERKLDLDEGLDLYCQQYAERELSVSEAMIERWAPELKKDILAFAIFCQQHKVKPLAIEISLASSLLGYGGQLDLPCLMTIEEYGDNGEVYKSGAKKGETKLTKAPVEIRALIDFKSNRENFYEENELQLILYRELWNEKFPGFPIERVFNWSPKNWRTSPTFNFKEQTGSKFAERYKILLELSREEFRDNSMNHVQIIGGVVDLDGDLTQNIEAHSFEEIARGRSEKKADITKNIERAKK
jgi:hypothetical protein